MKNLLVLRHAKSSWNNPGQTDHERPLNDRGRRSAPLMAQLVVQENLVPDLILCSTAQRARETCALLLKADGFDVEVVHLDELYLAAPDAYYNALAAAAGDHDTIMVIGHNPGLEDLVNDLTQCPTTMPTAALAHIEVADFQQLRPGRLVSHWIPRDLE